MTTALQLRRGTTAQHATFVGANGEVTVDTDKKTLVVNDGVTQGGTPLAREDALTKFVRHDTAAQGLTGAQQSNVKTNIGLGNVSNTADADKPVSTATKAALDGKLDKSGGTLTGPLTLYDYASSALHAVPKQQVENLINAAVSGLPHVPPSTYIGGTARMFTSSGTFIVPAGVTAVKVRGCGGGGGGGTGAGAGGTTSFGIYGAATGGSTTTPGTGAGGDINLVGGRGGTTGATIDQLAAGGAVGGGAGGGGATSPGHIAAPTGLLGGSGHPTGAATGYGNGGGCITKTPSNISAGYAGGYFERYVIHQTPGTPIAVTIGHAGAAGTNGYAGAPGMCIVEW